MLDIIQLLPDSIANQIAAGEVIQRPSSVVKELVENAIDAKSTKVSINIKDAGKTLIQIIDDGIGMSEIDARMSFERHATSKIQKLNDLFSIKTMGFRGEALASIASIAHVELKTKRKNDELGTLLEIAGSNIIEQEIISCETGSNFLVKNLFFNVPARRKFLKSNSTELRHIIIEFQRIVLTNPAVSFILFHNDNRIFNLQSTNLKSRIIDIFGKNINQNIIKVETDTSIIKIKGYIGKAEKAKKNYGEQYFFVNNRFMKHSYFHRAIINAYGNILPPETIPTYFIYLEIEPDKIDINIHPTKTEIKFEDEKFIFQILQAVVKEALGKFNIVPSLDFNTEGKIDIPVLSKQTEVNTPNVKINPNFNPFEEEKKKFFQKKDDNLKKINLQNWDKLYENFNAETEIKTDLSLELKEKNKINTTDNEDDFYDANNFFQLKKKYILTPIKSGLMLINQKYAHERILFENFMKSFQNKANLVQKSLFEEKIYLNYQDAILLKELSEDIKILGFEIEAIDENSFLIKGTPSEIKFLSEEKTSFNIQSLIENLLSNYQDNKKNIQLELKENLAKSLAKSASINYGNLLNKKEMRKLIDNLFACQMPNISPNGKKIITILSLEELDKRF